MVYGEILVGAIWGLISDLIVKSRIMGGGLSVVRSFVVLIQVVIIILTSGNCFIAGFENYFVQQTDCLTYSI